MQIGDNILCIKTHSKGLVVKGKTYPLLGISTAFHAGCPSADEPLYDVGIQQTVKNSNDHICAGAIIRCPQCGNITISDGIAWISSSLFASERKTERTAALEELLNLPIIEERSDKETVKILK